MLVCDASGLLAYFDSSHVDCPRVSSVIEADPGPFVVSPYVVAELDQLLAGREGLRARSAVLTELSGGAWELPRIEAADLQDMRTLIDRQRDRGIDIVDASLVLLARRYRTDRLLTLDRRRFRVIRTSTGRPFKLLPSSS
jgi:hypothetical protein